MLGPRLNYCMYIHLIKANNLEKQWKKPLQSVIKGIKHDYIVYLLTCTLINSHSKHAQQY